MTNDPLVTADALNGIYKALVGRPVDDVAVSAWCQKLTYEDVIRNIVSNHEFRGYLARLLSVGRSDIDSHAAVDTQKFYKQVEGKTPGVEFFKKIMQTHTQGGEYFDFHVRRFCELHGFLYYLNSIRPITRLLEISTMPFTTDIFRKYLGDGLTISTIDLPETMGGPSEDTLKRWGSNKHASEDLNTVDFLDLKTRLVSEGPYDVIIASEVVEHLQRDFAEVAAFMLQCLAPGGIVLVSTPNFLSTYKMRLIASGENPQRRFKEFNSNKGGHYHFREYTMKELSADVESVGGTILGRIYSDCYTDRSTRDVDKSPQSVGTRDLLILLFGNAESTWPE